MLGLACRCSSFTQFFARANVSLEAEKELLNGIQMKSRRTRRPEAENINPNSRHATPERLCWGHVTHGVGDVVDHDSGLSSSVVHRGQAVVAFLSSSVPDLKLHCCIIQTYRLCEEGSWKDNREQRTHPLSTETLQTAKRREESIWTVASFRLHNSGLIIQHRSCWKQTIRDMRFTASVYGSTIAHNGLTQPPATWQRKPHADVLYSCVIFDPLCSWSLRQRRKYADFSPASRRLISHPNPGLTPRPL